MRVLHTPTTLKKFVPDLKLTYSHSFTSGIWELTYVILAVSPVVAGCAAAVVVVPSLGYTRAASLAGVH